MTRQEFARHLALISLSSSLPEQIDALERFHLTNGSPAEDGLLSVDEVYIGGLCQKSHPMVFTLWAFGGFQLQFPFNAFGGVVRWVAPPDGKVNLSTAEELHWEMRSMIGETTRGGWTGYLRFIDQGGYRKAAPLFQPSGSVRSLLYEAPNFITP